MMADERDGESIQRALRPRQRASPATSACMHAGGVSSPPAASPISAPSTRPLAARPRRFPQFDKDDVEKAGLVKFDFLGLRNLTIIELAVRTSSASTGEQLDLMSLGFNDPAAYQTSTRWTPTRRRSSRSNRTA